MRLIYRLLPAVLFLPASQILTAQTIRYVSPSGNDNNAGTTWATAVRTIKKAMDLSGTPGDKIWIKTGTYYMDEGPGLTDNDRAAKLTMKDGVGIYGGFAGNETAIGQRQTALNPTIINGDIQQDGVASNNSRTLFYQNGLGGQTDLDGLVFTNAYNEIGSGLAGAISVPLGFIIMNGCKVLNNFSAVAGAGMECSGYVYIKNSRFENNTSNALGGALTYVAYQDFKTLEITNSIFWKNTGSGGAGAIWMKNANTKITNCVLEGNQGPTANQVIIETSTCSFANTIIRTPNQVAAFDWTAGSVVSLDHCISNQLGQVANETIYNVPPQYTDSLNGDFSLSLCSFGINRGNSSVQGLPSTDYAGNPRIQYDQVDIGAYEFIGQFNPSVLRVKMGGAGSNTGHNWANAYGSLQDAILDAANCYAVKEIWVSGGTYYPDEGIGKVNNDRNNCFAIRNFLGIYGGFAGTELLLSQRNLSLQNNSSTLSGELQQDNDNSNNAYNVFVGNSLDSTAIVDGFTIQDGAAFSIFEPARSRGGGIIVTQGKDPQFRNCIIKNNQGYQGAAIAVNNSSPRFINCVVANNNTTLNSGAVWNENSSSSFIHCSIGNNTIAGANPAVVVNTVVSSPVFLNTIVRGTSPAISGGTPLVSYSLIQNTSPWPGTGNLNSDPQFISEATGNLELNPCSPAVNSASSLGDVTTDLLGRSRPALGGTDMGAYETQTYDPSIERLYVKAGAAGTSDGSSWTNAFTTLGDALQKAGSCIWVKEIWVAAGTYYPDEGAGRTNDDRTSTFAGRNKLAVYGGFAGTETLLSQRNLSGANTTVLNGDIKKNSSLLDFSYNVVRLDGLDSTFVLDGFTVTNGNANGVDNSFKNYGGGILVISGNPAFKNCFITGNHATAGSGIANRGGKAGFLNCVIQGNASSFEGGAVYNDAAQPTFLHCTIANNTTVADSHIVFYTTAASTPLLMDCIVRGSDASVGGPGNPTIGWSVIQRASVYPGLNNSNGDPMFVNEAGGDLRLQSSLSPAFNTGASVTGGTIDILGNPRPALGGIDMGAYEQQDNADLVNLVTSAGILSPAFSPATTAYSTINTNPLVLVTATATARYAGFQTLQIRTNGGSYFSLTSGTPSSFLLLNQQINTVDVKVSMINGSTKTYTITVTNAFAPTITSLSTTNAKPGATIVLTGTNFAAFPANNVVYFGAVRATVSNANTTSLSVVVPAGAVYGRVSVLNTNTSLTGYSSINFNPTFAPNKGSITSSDFMPKVDFGTGTNPRGMTVGDVDGDGKPDLIVVNQDVNTISVFRNTSTAGTISAVSFAAKVDFTTGVRPTTVAFGDLDGDGKPDLVVSNYTSGSASVFRNTSSPGTIDAGSFATKVDFTVPGAGDIVIADFDGDGRPDLALAISAVNAVSVLRNTGSPGSITAGSFAPIANFATGALPVSIAAGDVDGDGRPDLATANYNGNSISVLRNASSIGSITTGSFATNVDFASGTITVGVTIGDLDGDGKAELVGANQNGGTISVLRNTSTAGTVTAASFAPKVDFNTNGPVKPVIGDLDGDGKPDLAVACDGSNYISVFRNTSTAGSITAASFAAKTDLVSGAGCWSVAIADLDGDGKPDLAATGRLVNTVSVFRNNPGPKIIYVKADAAGANNGSGWTNAYNSFQTAFQAAVADVNIAQVWVAAGTYKPTATADRNISFALKDSLAIFGGFTGTEASLSQRNPFRNPTVLSGDIGVINDRNDNTYHVFSNANIDSTAVLDGFTITGGNAGDIGGGMYNSNASPTIRNCIFRNNNSASWAGAVYCGAASNAWFINCLFTGNTAVNGGGNFNSSSSPVFVNCTMCGNSAPQGSFAWSQTNSLSKLTNCIVWGNSGSAALVNTVTSPYTVSYSITQESFAGTGNLVANPQFADTTDGNFTLLSCSPALNTGDNNALPAGISLDLAGRPRVFNTTVDMGVHERQAGAGQGPIYVDGTATGNADGTTWPHAYTKILPALNEMNNCGAAVSLSIAAGTYITPVILVNRTDVTFWGGYPAGGGIRNASVNPVILKGEFKVLKSAKIDGIKVQ